MHRFLDFEGFKPILGIYSGYSISLNGEIKYRTGDIKIPIRVDEHGEWLSLRCTDGTAREFNRAVLVSMVARDVSWPIDVCSRLTMYFLDGNNTNVHPSNTVWRPFPKDVEWKSGIRYIPGHSKYAINKNGDLWDTRTGKKRKWQVNIYGYIKTMVRSDVYTGCSRLRCRNLFKHRALMLAWSDYPINVTELHVNHKNGIKSDNKLSNFEWATYSANTQHAYDTGLNKTRGVKIKNTITGEEQLFSGIHEASKQLDIAVPTIVTRCKSDGTTIYANHLWKYSNSDTEWSKNPVSQLHSGLKQSVTIRHLTTKKISSFPSISLACKQFGINHTSMRKRCKKQGMVVYDGYQWIFSNDLVEWPDNPTISS